MYKDWQTFEINASHKQPGHEPDLVRVKMGRNSPGIGSNLHTVRVETARYGFCKRI